VGWVEALLLAIVQGLTEFLPVSSSGHLSAIQNYLSGFGDGDLEYLVLLHFGTLVAVIAYYRRDLWRMVLSLAGAGPQAAASRRLMWLVGAGTAPAALAYLLLGDWVDAAFGSLSAIAAGFMATGAILFATRRTSPAGRGEQQMRWRDALLVGAAQGVALLPGVSRSGSTIAAALFAGLDRELAVRYSFLLSIPAILGANVVKGARLLDGSLPPAICVAGTLLAAGVAYASIHVLLRVVRRGSLPIFAYYCWALGAAILFEQGLG
jgi:undecaprenyl-diphosphatase